MIDSYARSGADFSWFESFRRIVPSEDDASDVVGERSPWGAWAQYA